MGKGFPSSWYGNCKFKLLCLKNTWSFSSYCICFISDNACENNQICRLQGCLKGLVKHQEAIDSFNLLAIAWQPEDQCCVCAEYTVHRTNIETKPQYSQARYIATVVTSSAAGAATQGSCSLGQMAASVPKWKLITTLVLRWAPVGTHHPKIEFN